MKRKFVTPTTNVDSKAADLCPLARISRLYPELDVPGSDGAQLRRDCEVPGQLGPSGALPAMDVEVRFETVDGVAPDGAPRRVDWDGP